MKWNLTELTRKEIPFDFEETLSMEEEIKRANPDVVHAEPVHVSGTCFMLEEGEFVFNIHVHGNLTMICAVTLEEVPAEIDYEGSEIFARTDELGPDVNLIERGIINLDDIIHDYIILNIPYRAIKQGYEDKDNSDLEEDPKENPFASLLDNLK